MKAVIYDKKRSSDKLTYGDADKPVPTASQVLVRIFAASVNAADYRSMQMRLIPKSGIFGADISGTVESVGSGVRRFKAGDEVIGVLSDHGFGGFAEYAAVPEEMLVLKPGNISFEDSAALPLAGITALQALRDKGNIRSGQEVLIVGSAGGVGTFAIQLARYFGAKVTGVCSSRNAEQTRLLGADAVIDYAKEDFTRNVGAYDLILAVNGNYSLSACKKCLKANGRYVMVGGALAQIFKALLFGKLMSFGSRKVVSAMAKTNREDLDFIVKLAGEGIINSVIEKSFPLEKTPEAVRYAAEGHARGKVAIKVGLD